MPSSPPPLPRAAGLGLRAPHVREVLAYRPDVPWFEVHSENYFADGGPALASLVQIRADYPISLHGVGLSLGSVDPLDRDHLAKLRRLADRIEPSAVSEHLCWGALEGRHYNDLLPLPLTEDALALVCQRIEEAQSALGRTLLVENVSSYYAFPESSIPEAEFVAAVAQRTGCRLLLDVNNIYVNAVNHGLSADDYLASIPVAAVAEIHLAGFDRRGALLIDTHGARVDPAVWQLYAAALQRFGAQPTLIEWDADIPAFAVLRGEAAQAQRMLEQGHAVAP
jgi:uncharacterized protein (UPF0276 family)